MNKRIFNLLIVLCMLCGMLVLGTMTASATETSGLCGENITWVFDSETGTLTISGTGLMSYPLPTPPDFEEDPFYFDDVTPAAPWAPIRDSIEKIVVSEGIENLYEKAFTGCYNVTEVSLPSTLRWIGEKAFYGCFELRSLTIPEGVQDLGYMSFSNCGLESIVIPGSVTSMDMSVFKDCFCLQEVVISEGVKRLGSYMFADCSSLTDITIADSVVTIDSCAFDQCNALESVTLPEKLNYIGSSAFSGCTLLKSIHIPSGVTEIKSYTFGDCASLSAVTMEGIKTIEKNAFENCTSLESLTIPEGATTIAENAFLNCSRLKNVDSPDSMAFIADNAFDGALLYTDTSNWTGGLLYVGKYLFKSIDLDQEEISVWEGTTVIGESLFENFTNLKTVTLPDSLMIIQQNAFQGCSSLTSVVVPKSVKSIAYRAFYNCTGLESASILGNLEEFGGEVFYNCSSLSRVTIANANEISFRTFKGCAALEEITIPENVTFIGSEAFEDCISLQKVTFLSTYVETIEHSAFENCVSLKSMDLPEGIEIIMRDLFLGCTSLENVTIPESAWCMHPDVFAGCAALKSIYIPKNLTNIYEEYSGCTALTAIWVDKDNPKYSSDDKGVMYNKDKTTLIAFPRGYLGEYVIPETVTTIGESTFSGCKKLTSITIPASVNTIGRYAFSRCSNLESVILSQGITKLGEQSFYDCTALRSITIPKTVTSIGDYAFNHCTALEKFCVEEGNLNYSSDAYGALYNEDKTELLIFPAGYKGAFVIPESVTMIDHGSFQYTKGLTEVTIPGTVGIIRSNCFIGCTGLTEVTICEGVTDLYNHAFYGCTGLSTVILPKSVKSIGYVAFGGCENLMSLYILNPNCNFTYGPEPIADTEITTLYGEIGSTTEKHAKENGYKFLPLTDSVKLTINHSVEIANELAINYMVRADQLEGYEGYGYTMEVVLPVYEGNTQTGTNTVELQPVLKGDYYYFVLKGLSALQMNDTAQATVCISNGVRQVLSQVDNYSIATYAYNQLGTKGASEGLKRMCANLLQYGGKAQIFKGYRTDAQADAKMTAEQKTYLTALSTVTFNGSNNILDDVQDPVVTWAGKTLNLESRVTLRYVIDATDYAGTVEDLTLRVTYINSDGETVTVQIADPKVFNEEADWYAFDFAELRAAELRVTLSAAVYDGDVQVSPTLEYGVESYCSGKVNALGTLCRAMMAFSDSAHAFFTK